MVGMTPVPMAPQVAGGGLGPGSNPPPGPMGPPGLSEMGPGISRMVFSVVKAVESLASAIPSAAAEIGQITQLLQQVLVKASSGGDVMNGGGPKRPTPGPAPGGPPGVY